MSLATQCQPRDSVFTIDRRIVQAGYCAQRERFVSRLAAYGNAEGHSVWAAGSQAARILAERLCNDHA